MIAEVSDEQSLASLSDKIWDEIVRIRERLHKVEGSAAAALSLATELRTDMHRLREEVTGSLGDVRFELRKLNGEVEQMADAKEIAEAVSAALHARGPSLPLSFFWRCVTGVTALLLLASGAASFARFVLG